MARTFLTPIALPADPTSALQAATKQYVDNGDATKAPLDSPVFTTSVTLPGDPTLALQAGTKQYSDNLTANAAALTDTETSGIGPSLLASRTNLSPNPNGLVDNAGYSAKTDSGTGITAAPARSATGGADGSSTSLTATFVANATGEVTLPQATVAAGTTYTISIAVKAPAGITMVMSANWFASGAYSTTTVPPNASLSASRRTATGNYIRLSYTVVGPGGANQLRPYLSFYGAAAGQTISLSQYMVEAATAPGVYFDGNSPGGAWTGTAGSSNSTYSAVKAHGAASATDPRFLASSGDVALYGDYYSNMPRWMSTAAKTATSGTLWMVGGIAGSTFTARTVRMFSGTAGSGGNFLVGIYTGASTAALTRVATITTATTITATTMYEWVLSATVPITPGLYVYAGVLATMTTAPTFQVLGGTGTPTGFMNPTTAATWSASITGQSALPTTANLTTGYASNGLPHWFALGI